MVFSQASDMIWNWKNLLQVWWEFQPNWQRCWHKCLNPQDVWKLFISTETSLFWKSQSTCLLCLKQSNLISYICFLIKALADIPNVELHTYFSFYSKKSRAHSFFLLHCTSFVNFQYLTSLISDFFRWKHSLFPPWSDHRKAFIFYKSYLMNVENMSIALIDF